MRTRVKDRAGCPVRRGVALLFIGVGIGLGAARIGAQEDRGAADGAPTGEVAADQVENSDDLPAELSVEALAEAARESVVVINYFGRDGTEEGVGAGIVVGTNGLIATCLHVIGEARPIRVRLRDGTRREVVEVRAWDRNLDLAMIRVSGPALKPLPLGDSAALRQGASVVAIGNPLGLEHSVVRGVMSARREFDGVEMLQLAIPIEPGNSGGPLLDMRGRVQGVINMKSAVSRNLGFAIPVDLLKPLLDRPNPVPMERWLTIGALNPREWQPLFGARWSRSGGRIRVEEPGTGFGGRSLCLSHRVPPPRPYEVAVTVKLDDESGAAGLVFGSDGEHRHYGFYPTGGRLRLTRFDGPNVFSWTILETMPSEHYRPGDWNVLKVRWEAGWIRCLVNGKVVIESRDDGLTGGRVGLAKFRDTKAEFKSFRMSARLEDTDGGVAPELVSRLREAVRDYSVAPGGAGREEDGETELEALLALLADEAEAGRMALEEEARRLDSRAKDLRRLAGRVHRESVHRDLVGVLSGSEAEVDLFHAALLVAKLDRADLDVAGYRDQLSEMGQEILAGLAADVSAEQRRRVLVRYLFEENGYHSSRHDYYHRANSQMDRVMDDREGLPLTLSVLFMELAGRIGLEGVEGVPLPGHFIVRHRVQNANADAPANGDEVLLDVFEGGRVLTREDAEVLARTRGGLRLREEHWAAATKQDIILRMLRNLINVAEREGEGERALHYLDAVLAVAPESFGDRLDRAGKRLLAGDAAGAREDLKWVLEREPPGVDLEALAELYRSLENR